MCIRDRFKTIIRQLEKSDEVFEVIDVYEDKLHRDKTEMIKDYKNSVTWATHLYFISPVWWFRLTPRMEIFFDEVLTPGYAYKFVPVVGPYAYPKPFLGDKQIRTYITHGAPALPVKTLYLNSPKLRLVMGVFTFVFGWKLALWTKTKQFWSVPFVSQKKREQYLETIRKDVVKDLKKHQLKINRTKTKKPV